MLQQAAGAKLVEALLAGGPCDHRGPRGRLPRREVGQLRLGDRPTPLVGVFPAAREHVAIALPLGARRGRQAPDLALAHGPQQLDLVAPAVGLDDLLAAQVRLGGVQLALELAVPPPQPDEPRLDVGDLLVDDGLRDRPRQGEHDRIDHLLDRALLVPEAPELELGLVRFVVHPLELLAQFGEPLGQVIRPEPHAVVEGVADDPHWRSLLHPVAGGARGRLRPQDVRNQVGFAVQRDQHVEAARLHDHVAHRRAHGDGRARHLKRPTRPDGRRAIQRDAVHRRAPIGPRLEVGRQYREQGRGGRGLCGGRGAAGDEHGGGDRQGEGVRAAFPGHRASFQRARRARRTAHRATEPQATTLSSDRKRNGASRPHRPLPPAAGFARMVT
ncbi:hypothetical protein D3C72_988070 [compost metagenome]